jgi:hypothetical protein
MYLLILYWQVVTQWSTCYDWSSWSQNDDEHTHYYASFWFKICHTTLELLGEMLSLYDIVLEDETTQTSKSHVIDEFGSSTRCRKHR